MEWHTGEQNWGTEQCQNVVYISMILTVGDKFEKVVTQIVKYSK